MLIRPTYTYDGIEYPSIGGSDMYNLQNETRRKKLMQIQLNEIEPDDLSQNFIVQAGTHMESFLRNYLRMLFPNDTIKDGELIRDTLPHPKLQRITTHTNVDGWFNEYPIEIKFSVATQLTGDEYIKSKEPQCQHHMDITNTNKCLLVYVLKDMVFRHTTILRDDDFIKKQRELIFNFQADLIANKFTSNLEVPSTKDNQERRVLNLIDSKFNFSADLTDLIHLKNSLKSSVTQDKEVTKQIKEIVDPRLTRQVISAAGNINITQNKNGKYTFRF
tara:strand:- start:351 stop:1175 length:825 start_codon:yes stop_codon:yes gene_type:complete